jgi:hypothetical protein
MSDGSKWRYRRCLGNTGECRRRGYPGSCALKAADPGWARRDERGSVVLLLRRAGLGTGGVAASGRAVLGTGGVAAVSPVVTTVALEK